MSFVFSTARATTKNIYNLYEQGSPKRGCLFFWTKEGAEVYRDKDPKGNPGIPGIDLFRAFRPAVFLFPACGRGVSRAVCPSAPHRKRGGNRLGLHPWGRALCRLRVLPVPRDDCGAVCLGLDQIHASQLQAVGIPKQLPVCRSLPEYH